MMIKVKLLEMKQKTSEVCRDALRLGDSRKTSEVSVTTRFLRAVQSVFLQKRHLETADLYEPPLDMFGADAVERWFTVKEVEEIVTFANRFTTQ